MQLNSPFVTINFHSMAEQLLLEDLNGNRSRGLLHSIPESIDGELLSLLEGCFYCNHSTEICPNRFTFVEPLMAHIDHLLGTIY